MLFACDCEFDTYDDDPEESWHYRRVCAHCGEAWWGLHCPHDGRQNPCPGCGVVPTPQGQRVVSPTCALS